MNWRDLKEGDFVIPADPNGAPWLVLHVGDNEEGEHRVTYASLGSGAVHTASIGADGFNPMVKVLRDGEDVNK